MGVASRGLAGCGQVTFQGCCDGDTVWFCKSKKLKKLSCAGNPKCGWSATYNLYDCGTAGAADPAGKHPLSCAAAFGDAGPPGDGPATDGPATDGPATDGPAPDQGGPQDASPQDASPKDANAAPDSGACGAMTHQGCCDGGTLWFCDAGKVKSITCGYNPKCGWDAKASVYDCGTAGGADPSGKHPRPCASLLDGGVAATDAGAPDSSPGGDAGVGCGKLTIEGCCDGDTVWYCSGGKAQHYSCGKSPKCGWNPFAKWYYCKTNGGADPGGKYPKSCKGMLWDGGPPATDTGPPEMGPDLPLPDLAPDTSPPLDQGQDLAADVTSDVTQDTAADVATPDSFTTGEDGDDGCGCAVEPRGGAGLWGLLLLAALAIAARQRDPGVRRP